MVPSRNNNISTPTLFILAALLLLVTGLLWGLAGALQYIIPGLFKNTLSFERIRPLHVSSMVFWIIIAAMGAVATYLQQHTGKKWSSAWMLNTQFIIFAISIIIILVCYAAGRFGGREYWEFHPLLALPIAAGWLLFLVNFFRSIGSLKRQPVYVWMWVTGIVFFLFTFIESYLWTLPYFRNNIIKDMTIQWKSYGSMVGSWNMLIYGSGIYLMDKISNSQAYSRSTIAFLLYFTGLFNLMFNWGHHIYTLPTHGIVKHLGYIISMTELLILGRIIYKWRSTLDAAKKYMHQTAYRFLLAADIWIFLTLLLAIAMSVPAINVYTHGTHITVAHTMGATIGINTFLLLAVASDILGDNCFAPVNRFKFITRAWWVSNISLFVFWISLIIAGVLKAGWQMSESRIPFSVMMERLRPCFIAFFISGITLSAGIMVMVYAMAWDKLACYRRSRREIENLPHRQAGRKYKVQGIKW